MNNSNMKNCECSVCGATAHTIPGTRHRRCGGSKGAHPRKKPSPISTTTKDHHGRPVGVGPHKNQGVWS